MTTIGTVEVKILIEGRNSCQVLSDDQRVNALRSLQRAHGLEIAQMANDMMIGQNTPAPENVSGRSSDLHRFPNIVQLGH